MRNSDSIATQIKAFIRRETGLVVNLHFFRHLAHKVLNDTGPGGLETGSVLLGHTSTRTTARAYSNLKAAPALRAYDDALINLGKRRPAPKRARLR